jgi:predicted negative regulator of RcsB-dependent stress response
MPSLNPANRNEVSALLADLEAAASHISPSADRRLFELLEAAKAASAPGDAAALSAAAQAIEKHCLNKAEAVVSAAGALRRALDTGK